ncbi:ribonuclease T2 [Vigna unguiculata]|uniref:Ribonuclease T2 n=1 Tax=Vigna unguiculata TaxID=3917 RepID=A0A4D6LX01_VIGUN|nr:ribonuclease T2 [Vigna unguiculata]
MAIDQRFSTTIQLQSRRIKSFCGPRLQQVWPNYYSTNYTKFWEHEWEKHGTCSNMQQFDFFRLTLDIYARNDLQAILINAGISRRKPYHINDIISAIRNSAIGVEPELHCRKSRKSRQSGKSGSGSGRRGLIFEIRICLNTDPIPQYINCASQGTCTSPNANMTCNLVKSAILSPKIVNEKIK